LLGKELNLRMIEIKEKENCCGCEACRQSCPKQCITMYQDSEGFLYPNVNLQECINCHICEKVCPIINQLEGQKPLSIYAAKNTNKQIRSNSSSGGVFMAIAEKVIDEGGVVFGARFNEKWEIVHDYTETKSGIHPFMGSKYFQSNIKDTYSIAKSFLKENRKVLFTGTPCQIAGLKHYLKIKYDNLITVDVVCHGVPSPKVWLKYLESLQSSGLVKEPIDDISFRKKTLGWKNYGINIHSFNTNYFMTKNADLFMQGFINNLYLRPSCYCCSFKCGRSGSDITLGDFWGMEDIIPYFDDDQGTSLAIINNIDLDKYIHSLPLELVRVRYEEIIRSNRSILESAQKTAKRDKFFKRLDKSMDVRMTIRKSLKHNFIRHFIEIIKNIFI
jgi:coenzyme F420-reducing hydrogenase beta subunit